MAFTPITLTPTYGTIDANMVLGHSENSMFFSNRILDVTNWRWGQIRYLLTQTYSTLLKINYIDYKSVTGGTVEIAFAAGDNKNPVISIQNGGNNYSIYLVENGYVARHVVDIPKENGIEVAYNSLKRNKIYLNGQEFIFNSIHTESGLTIYRLMFTSWHANNTKSDVTVDLAYIGVSYTNEDFSLLENRIVARNKIFEKMPLYRPEIGWSRVDETNSNIIFSEGFGINNYVYHYGGSIKFNNAIGSSIKFKFKGDKFRLITPYDANRSLTHTIIIDGISEEYTEYTSGATVHRAVVYEKIDLPFETHTVEIIKGGDGNITLDAIDIGINGDILPYEFFFIKKDSNFLGKNSFIKTQSPTNSEFTNNGLDKDEIVNFINSNLLSTPFSIVKNSYVDTPSIQVKQFLNYVTLKSKTSFTFKNLKEFNSINFVGSNLKLAISTDNINWKKFNGTSWMTVDITLSNKDTLYSVLNTSEEILTLTDTQIKELVGEVENPIFYVFVMLGKEGVLDKISMNVDLNGYFKVVSPKELNVDVDTRKIGVTFKENGDYRVKYQL